MSCRETKANSACTSMAQGVSGLPDREIQSRFHALKREGQKSDVAAPTKDEYLEFLTKQRRLLDGLEEIEPARRRSIATRLDDAFDSVHNGTEPIPDGATFFALREVVVDAQIAADRAYEADLAARLPGMSPEGVDGELAEKWNEKGKIAARLQSATRSLDYIKSRHAKARATGATLHPWDEEELAKAQEYVATQSARLAKAARREDPYSAEFRRRGGWSRYYLVIGSGNGHLHTSMNCSTTYDTTQYAWNPDLSGHSQDEAIEEFGEKCCTVCMPDAPANPKFNGPGRRDRAAQEEKAREKAERAAAKAVKAITHKDGGVLKDSSGYAIKTLRTAEITLVSDSAYIAYLRKNRDDPEWTGRGTLAEHQAHFDSLIQQRERAIFHIEEAIAAKKGITVAEVQAEAAPKIKKKVDKGEW
jgi:hypothetical protein